MGYRIALVWAVLTGPVVALLLDARHAAWVAMLGYHAGCVVAAACLRGRWGPRPRAAVLLAWGLGSAALVFGVSGILVPEVFPPAALDRARGVLEAWGMSRSRAPWLLTYYVLVNPVVEEWFWRSTLLTANGPVPMTWRAVFSIVAFVPFHGVVLVGVFGTGGLVWLLLGISAMSALWTGLQIRRGSTWFGYAGHMGADAGVALLYVRFLSSG